MLDLCQLLVIRAKHSSEIRMNSFYKVGLFVHEATMVAEGDEQDEGRSEKPACSR